ncbi:MAG: hypothetical protein ABI625_01380 [bacterium]
MSKGASTVRVILVGAMLMASLPNVLRAQSSRLTLLGYNTSVPAQWVVVPPTSKMRLAQFSIRHDDALGAAEIVVYFFGEGQGGTVESNLARWKAQFSTSDGAPVPETITRDTSRVFPITFAEYRGTYARGIGPGNTETAKAGQTLLAGIAETPRGTLFIQLFGDTAAVAAERAAFMQFVRGLRE